MSKLVYPFLIIGGQLCTAFFVALALNPATDEMAAAVPIPMLVSVIAYWALVYNMWAAMPAGEGRTTPGKALGLLFAPIFNIYWVFNVFVGFAADYNKYLDKQRSSAPRLSEGLMIAMLLCMGIPVVGWIVLTIGIAKIVDAMRVLRDGRAPALSTGPAYA